MAWAETLAFVKLPVFGKQISCQFGGLLKQWPLTTNDVMKPASFCWRSHATSAVWRKWKRVMWLRPTSLLKEIIWPRPLNLRLKELGNWGQTCFEYSSNAWEISVEGGTVAHLWRNQRCESFEFRCLHSSDVGLGMLFWILSVGPRISGDFTGFSKAHKDLLPTGF